LRVFVVMHAAGGCTCELTIILWHRFQVGAGHHRRPRLRLPTQRASSRTNEIFGTFFLAGMVLYLISLKKNPSKRRIPCLW
jgi:hypothetical protein